VRRVLVRRRRPLTVLATGLATGLVPDASTTPLVGMFAFFLTVVVVRTQVTYWLARTLTERAVVRAEPRSALLRRFARWLADGGVDSGVAALNRWGLLVVPLSFLLPGTKTVVNAAAGVTRMPFGRYTAAMLVGCVTHATIYATVGWAAWTAVVGAAAGSPWAVPALLAAATLVAATVLVHRRVRTWGGRRPHRSGGPAARTPRPLATAPAGRRPARARGGRRARRRPTARA